MIPETSGSFPNLNTAPPVRASSCSLMYGVLGNPAFAEDIAIETGNTAFLKFLLTSPLAASIKHEFLAFFEVSYNKIIRHQRNPLPMIKVGFGGYGKPFAYDQGGCQFLLLPIA